MNHAGANGAIVQALLSQAGVNCPQAGPVRGIVVAATGNGTVHHDLEAALRKAQVGGVTVWLATRCASGRVLPTPGHAFPDSNGLSPVKARVALMLALISQPMPRRPEP